METSNTQKAIRGMSSQTVVTIVLGVVEIVTFSIMSRLLSQDDFGYYASISAIVTVFACFSDAGIGSAIIQRKDATQRFINVAFTVSFICGSLAMGLLLLLSAPLAETFISKNMTIPLMLTSVTLLVNCLTSVNTSIMYRKLEFLKVGIINLISLAITSFVAIILAYKGLGYYSILVKAVLYSILTYIISLYACKTHLRFCWDKDIFKDILSFSGWLTLSGFFRDLANQMDRLLMSRLLSVTDLGAYNRPKEFISSISGKISGIFDTALFPVLSQIQNDKESTRNAYLRSLYLLNLASTVLALLFVFNGRLLIRVFFGEEWMSVLPIFQVLSISIIFSFDARLADCYFRSLGWTKQQFFFRIFEVIIKFIGVILGYRWGALGIAVSVLATNIITVILKHFYIGVHLGVPMRKGLSILLESCQISMISIPLLIITFILMPDTLIGDLLIAVVNLVWFIIAFVFAPSIVGRRYRNNDYKQIRAIISKKLKI